MRAFISFFFLFSFALDASQQQTMTTSQKQELSYLRQANQNVVEADELMDISLYELERQGEVIRRVHRKNVEINGSLDRADKTLTEMENPWFPSLLVKSSGPSDLQHNVNVFYRKKNPFEVMDGYMWKRSRWLRQWRLRYFSLEGNRLVYYHTKEDKEEQKDWKSYLRLEEFHGVEKVECKKVGKFCFRLLTHKLEKRIYFSIAAKGNYQDWFRHLTDIIKPGL